MSATCLTHNKFFSWSRAKIGLFTRTMAEDGGWSPEQIGGVDKQYLDVCENVSLKKELYSNCTVWII
jgi:hypothetical protein